MVKFDEYIDLRKDGKLVSISERDKANKGVYYLFSTPYRLVPLYIEDILKMINEDNAKAEVNSKL